MVEILGQQDRLETIIGGNSEHPAERGVSERLETMKRQHNNMDMLVRTC